MPNARELEPNRVYEVVKEFTDFDKIVHPTGERWTYRGTKFMPYDDWEKC